MSVMIDWLTFKFPLDHIGRLGDGRIMKIDADGAIEWMSDCRMVIAGSHDKKITVKTCEIGAHGDGTAVQISGNPAKWFQGHNLFGTSDVNGLVNETILAICKMLELNPTEEEKYSWATGDWSLSRIDVNRMYSLGSRELVNRWLVHASKNARVRMGVGIWNQGTLYYGKNSRRWTLRCYAKGNEIAAKGHQLPPELTLGKLPEYADDKLRLEVVLKQLELKRLGLHSGKNWIGNDAAIDAMHTEYLRRLDMSNQKLNVLETELKPALLRAYRMWEAGLDLQEAFSKNTYYKYVRELKQFGVDISIPVPDEEEASNVVSIMNRIPSTEIELIAADIPEWAIGTPQYFQPRKFG